VTLMAEEGEEEHP